MWLPPPSLGQIGQSIVAALTAWREREATHALRRRLIVVAVVIALAALGPVFIALAIFPDRPTSVRVSGLTCVYDAAPDRPFGRLTPPPTPQAVVVGQRATLPVYIRNSGTCAWDDRVTLHRIGGNLSGVPEVITATETGANVFFAAQVPFTAPTTIGVFDAVWRMRAPDGQSFGVPESLLIITHQEGVPPAYPAESPFSLGRLITLVALALPGALGFGVALDRAGRFVREFYSLKSEARARAWTLRRLFNWGKGASATVKDAEIKYTPENETIEKIGGPGSLSIHGGMVAVLERGRGFSRIVGPGGTGLGAFERVRAVIDARQLKRTKTESAFSKDGVEVKAEATVTFKLMKQKDGEQAPQPQAKAPWSQQVIAFFGFKVKQPKPPDGLPASPDAIRAIVYESPAGSNWDGSVGSGLGDVIPKKMLDELWAPDDPDRHPRREIVDDLLKNGKESLRKRGIELIDLSIDPLVVDKSIDEQRRGYWQTNLESRARIIKAEGEAEALRQQQTARAEAQAELIQAIAQSFRILSLNGVVFPSREVALKMLDVIAHTMKATLEGTSEQGEVADKALRNLERLERTRKALME